MPSEHESAVATWLTSRETKRELSILKRRFPRWTEFQRIQIALSVEILMALNVYEIEQTDLNSDDEPPEPWKS